jgi:hypothetical protein
MKIIACGECHFTFIKKNLDPLLYNDKIPFIIYELNISNGGIEYVNSLLDFYRFTEDDIFLIGSSVQEKIRDPIILERELNNLIQRIQTLYRNSKIIFYNAKVRSDHPYYEKINVINDIKMKFNNNKNVFVYNFNATDSDFDDSKSHFLPEIKDNYIKELANFIKTISSELLKNRFNQIPINLTNVYNFDYENDEVSILFDFKKCTYFKIDTESHTNPGTETNLIPGKNATNYRKQCLKFKNLKRLVWESDGGIIENILVKNY